MDSQRLIRRKKHQPGTEPPPRKKGKRWLVLAFLLPASLALSTGLLPAQAAEPAVTIPWAEFQQLYAAQQKPKDTPTPASQFSIQQAEYHFEYQGTEPHPPLAGRVTITGQWLSGKPQPIALFDNDLAVTAINKLNGGNLMNSGGKHQFLADQKGEFVVDLAVAIKPSTKGEYLFRTPPALSNKLVIESTTTRHIEGDGLIEIAAGRFAFGSRQQLRFNINAPQSPAPINIDIASSLSVVSNRLQQQTWLVSDSDQRDVVVAFDPSMTWLKTNAGELTDSGRLTLRSIPANTPIPLLFERPWKNRAVKLPSIAENRGTEGMYALKTSLGGELSTKKNSAATLSAVPARLKAAFPHSNRLQQSKNGAVQLQFSPYQPVEQPPLIVDNIGYYSSYTNDGKQLSTLRLTVPPQHNQQLSLPRINDVEIWSLTVNGKTTTLLNRSNDDWLIPLSGKHNALIELTWVHQHQRPGLQGKLPLNIPQLGLAARSLSIVLALPPRLELLSMEGDLSPATPSAIPTTVPMHGAARFFSRPFYRGEAITASLLYHEPIDPVNHQTNITAAAVEQARDVISTPWVIE